MNRRGFISLLTGAAGAALVPWRGTVEPVVILPPRATYTGMQATGWQFTNLSRPFCLTQESLEDMLDDVSRSIRGPIVLVPSRLIISPQVKRLIDTDPIVRRAAELVLGRRWGYEA